MPDPRRWREPSPLSERPAAFTGFRIVDEILYRRGFRTEADVRAWLNPSIGKECAGLDLTSFEAALRRIETAVRDRERILIFGDYDCDGITSVAILTQALRAAIQEPALVSWELPGRGDGYGLRADVIDRALADGVDLLIAIDCGSNDVALIASAVSRGLEVVVIDHHQISVQIPDDALIVNPQRDPELPLRTLTSAGLAYMLVVCLARDGYDVAIAGANEQIYLDLAAIGTVADVGHLSGLNRAIVRAGVEQLRRTRRLGLRALARRLRADLSTATEETISFKFAPKLNAPGRIGSPDIALKLLLATDWDEAEELAQAVIGSDGERKAQTELVMAEVAAVLSQLETLPPVIVLASNAWPTGVLGPVAAKVAERHGRPAIVLAGSEDHLSGSGRSVGDWDLAGALQSLDHMLVRHGGHARAAGLTITRDRVSELGSELSALFEQTGTFETVTEVAFDADIDSDAVTLGLVEQIERLGPFGSGNERPILRWRGLIIPRWEPVGSDRSHAQVWLQGADLPHRAIYFGGATHVEQIGAGGRVDALVELSLGYWNGNRRIDARIVDLQPSG
jgi:single-stranded-DNA-specific exonuclease